MGWGLRPQVTADAAKPAHTHVSWLGQLTFHWSIWTRIVPVSDADRRTRASLAKKGRTRVHGFGHAPLFVSMLP